MKVKLKKQGNRLNQLIQPIKQLNNHRVEVGHFSAQGTHYSGYSYPELMAFHHTGYEDDRVTIPPRPLLDFLWASNLNLSDSKIRATIKAWGRREPSIESNVKLLNDIGLIIAKKEQGLFGKSPPLEANAPSTIKQKGRNTPLVDTGELKSKVAFRNSIEKILKEV